ncbi:hypothetical protein Q5752_000486 [Cryptotrichosporon argae]
MADSIKAGLEAGVHVVKQALATVTKPSDRAWWKEATVYQIYPASFADHAANGHGTLRGVLARIPYLHDLGVDVVWFSPIYASPQADMGYDISDYRAIDARYGSLEDWDAVRDACHERRMKVVMDLVVNHTSDQHAWFTESRSSRTNPKRDWYIWRDGTVDASGVRHPPNNWNSSFGAGPTWTYDEHTDQWYLHLFLKEQPDLNWENAEVRAAVWDTMRWWLDRGADGFRMDVINYISKVPGLPDAPVTVPGRECQPFGPLSINGPKVHDWLKEMNREVLCRYDCFAVGETPGNDAVEVYAQYSRPESRELQMVFHFHHFGFDRKQGAYGRREDENWKLTEMKKVFNMWQVDMERAGGWNSNYLENHDQPRTITRLASDHPADRARSAKLLAMFHSSLGGTQFVYQGQEIGLCNVPRNWPEDEYKDVATIQYLEGERVYRRQTTGEADPDMSDCLRGIRRTARDNGRTPMQWDETEYAGFSKAKPWMRVHDDYADGWNAKAQMADPDSVWRFWQRMLRLRKEYDTLIYGSFIPLDEANEESYAWGRTDKLTGQALLVVLNFARGDGRGKNTVFHVPADIDVDAARLLITNGAAKEGSSAPRAIDLEPWEGRILSHAPLNRGRQHCYRRVHAATRLSSRSVAHSPSPHTPLLNT